MLCHRVSYSVARVLPAPYAGYSQGVYCTGGALANSAPVQVMCRPDDNHDTFIRRFLETPAAAALWPRAFAKIREKRFQICDDFRTYVVPNGLQSDLHNMFVYLTDGTL